MLKYRHRVMFPVALGGCIIIAMVVGKDLGHVLVNELKRCLPASWFRGDWLLRGVFGEDVFVTCFGMFMFALPVPWLGSWWGGGPRIWAEGFILSSQRRIRSPRFRPTSKSLCCMFLWTLSAMSKTTRVRLVAEIGNRFRKKTGVSECCFES